MTTSAQATRGPVESQLVTRNGWDDELDILPDVTVDEAGYGWGDDPQERADDDRRLREERPPHWDDPGH